MNKGISRGRLASLATSGCAAHLANCRSRPTPSAVHPECPVDAGGKMLADEYGNSMIDQIREKVGGYDNEAPEAAGQAIEMSTPEIAGPELQRFAFRCSVGACGFGY